MFTAKWTACGDNKLGEARLLIRWVTEFGWRQWAVVSIDKMEWLQFHLSISRILNRIGKSFNYPRWYWTQKKVMAIGTEEDVNPNATKAFGNSTTAHCINMKHSWVWKCDINKRRIRRKRSLRVLGNFRGWSEKLESMNALQDNSRREWRMNEIMSYQQHLEIEKFVWHASLKE